jgi:uncharacterized protein YhjY with autotransporter beta-barrel domain
LDGAIYGGYNTYESSRSGLGRLANGNTEGAEWSTFISGGYDFHFGQLTVGPIAALQYTYVNINSFSENGSLAPLAIHTRSAESLRTDFGFRAYYIWQLGKVLVEPNLRTAWEHEYKYSALPITAGFAGIPGPSATFFGPDEGHDSAIVSAGVLPVEAPGKVQKMTQRTAYFNGVYIVVMKMTNIPGTKGKVEDILYKAFSKNSNAPSPNITPKINSTYVNGVYESGAIRFPAVFGNKQGQMTAVVIKGTEDSFWCINAWGAGIAAVLAEKTARKFLSFVRVLFSAH